MAKYWFKPKRFGYGFYPVSIEGWIATFLLLVLVLLSAAVNNMLTEPGPDRDQVIRFILDAVMLSAISCLFFEKKMQDSLKWRWGKKNR